VNVTVLTKRDAIQRRLEELLDQYEKAPRIEAKLTVDDGHDYWWFQEFGTADQYSAGATPGLETPPSVEGEAPGGSDYFIFPVHAKALAVRLKDGTVLRRQWVIHPGHAAANGGTGIVRVPLHNVRRYLSRQLQNLSRRVTLPDRDELVDLFNFALDSLVEEVKNRTPVSEAPYSGDHPTHLRDAWRGVPAK
jgi:hypothetical protein